MASVLHQHGTIGFPETLPGFEKINRFRDRKNNGCIAKILPGEYYVTKQDESIATVLGSCVSVCIRDVRYGIGGMNHFMLPDKKDGSGGRMNFKSADKATRYGIYAMEHMINDIIKYGGKRNNFEIKMCGAGRIIQSMTDVGLKNIEFIKTFLQTEGYDVVSEDLGDIYPRKVRYSPKTGKLMIKKLRTMHNQTIVDREMQFKNHLDKDLIAGEVEMF